MLIARLCAALIGLNALMPMVPPPEGSDFIETLSCATGRVIRIELPGQPAEPSDEAPMPCHAVCARDDDDPSKAKKGRTANKV